MDNEQTDGDATIIAPGVGQGDATVVSEATGDATVVVSQPGGDRTQASGRAAIMDLATLKPRVEFTLRAHNTYGLANMTAQNYLMADIRAYFAGGMAARAPVALALAIDRSGSMEGKPIESVKSAVSLILDQLTDADMLSIVTFGENVDVLMPCSRVINPGLIRQHVERIQPKGTTNLYGGMGRAAEELLGSKSPQHLTRVLVLTDGEANEGITEYHDIITQARQYRMQGATISTIGLGVEYNEELMRGIAKNTGGNYYYIDTIDEIPQVFDRELKDFFSTVATGVSLSIELPEGVELTRAYGYDTARGGRRVSLELPDLAAGETLPVLFQLGVKPHPPARFRVAKSELKFRYFGAEERSSVRGDMVVEFTTNKDQIMGGIDPVVEVAMREKDIVASLKRAGQMMASDVGTATMIIGQAQAQLAAAGKSDDATLVGIALSKAQRGEIEDATKTLSVAEFDLEEGKRRE